MRFNLLFFLLVFAGLGCDAARVAPVPGEQHKILTKDGAWCWFQDPRVVVADAKGEQLIAQWMTKSGELQLGLLNLQSGATEHETLKQNWDINDHNVGSYLVLPDRRLMVFYARHNKQGLFVRTSKSPGSISDWGEEVTITDTERVTYNHPVFLAEEGRFFVFFRGPSWKPTFCTSTDGINWSEQQILLQKPGREARDIRPYLKVATDNKRRIHFAFTDGHPAVEPENSVYYMRYESGAFFDVRGRELAAGTDASVAYDASAVVYDGSRTGIRAWVWDIAEGHDGNPVIAYTRVPDPKDHRYHYGRWDGDAWQDSELTEAGPYFPIDREGQVQRELYYSAGITLDHLNPERLALSRQMDSVFEIEVWQTTDAGQSWQVTPITAASAKSNVRPVFARGPAAAPTILWMHGDYYHYRTYETDIRYKHLDF